MSKCRNCGRHGLFLMINIHTGLCSECQKKLELQTVTPVEPQAPVERSIEFPSVYIGNCTKSKITEKYDDVELRRPDKLPDFSKIECCDDVTFSNDNGVIVAKRLNEILGFVDEQNIASKIIKSLENKRPIFSQILGYDDETGEIHIVIAFYKIVLYDYDQYAEDNDSSLEYEDCIGYF